MNYSIMAEGAGIFSQYIRILQEASNLSCEKLHLRSYNSVNHFDSIFDQSRDNSFTNLSVRGAPRGNYTNRKPIENSKNLNYYKNLVNSLKFNNNFLEKVSLYEKYIDSDTIGVHVRLTDMNILHPEYGIVGIEDYISNMENGKKYFVASDNEESLQKLENIYKNNIIYVPYLKRAKLENDNSYKLQIKNLENSDFWQEAFLEMYLLSKCGTLLCRTSNVANCSIIHSKTIKKIIRI